MRRKSESCLCLKHIRDYASSSVNRRLSGSYSISKSCAARTKGVIFVGLKIQKMEHHASLPRFSLRGLLSFMFSAETILFGLLSLQVLDLAETGNMCGKPRPLEL